MDPSESADEDADLKAMANLFKKAVHPKDKVEKAKLIDTKSLKITKVYLILHAVIRFFRLHNTYSSPECEVGEETASLAASCWNKCNNLHFINFVLISPTNLATAAAIAVKLLKISFKKSELKLTDLIHDADIKFQDVINLEKVKACNYKICHISNHSVTANHILGHLVELIWLLNRRHKNSSEATLFEICGQFSRSLCDATVAETLESLMLLTQQREKVFRPEQLRCNLCWPLQNRLKLDLSMQAVASGRNVSALLHHCIFVLLRNAEHFDGKMAASETVSKHTYRLYALYELYDCVNMMAYLQHYHVNEYDSASIAAKLMHNYLNSLSDSSNVIITDFVIRTIPSIETMTNDGVQKCLSKMDNWQLMILGHLLRFCRKLFDKCDEYHDAVIDYCANCIRVSRPCLCYETSTDKSCTLCANQVHSLVVQFLQKLIQRDNGLFNDEFTKCEDCEFDL